MAIATSQAIFKFVVSSFVAAGLALFIAVTSAGTILAKFAYIYKTRTSKVGHPKHGCPSGEIAVVHIVAYLKSLES